MKTLILTACVGILSAAEVAAQHQFGEQLPAVAFVEWPVGPPVRWVEEPPACAVFVFCTVEPHWFDADADYLGDLARRYGERGVVVTAVVEPALLDQARDQAPRRWAGCRVAVDAERSASIAWGVGPGNPWHIAVLDRQARLAFFGEADAGLVDAIDHVLDGSFDAQREAQAFEVRTEVAAMFDDATAEIAPLLERALAYAPRDGMLRGLAYLTAATKQNDRQSAQQALQTAVATLDKEALPFATFADLVLRGDPRRPELAKSLRAPLQTAAAIGGSTPLVQLAFLRTLVLAGDHRQVGRMAMRMRKLVVQRADDAVDFAAILSHDESPQIHRDLASAALDEAERLGVDARRLAAARYGVALRCAEDPVAARKVLDDYLQDQVQRIGLNNDAWYLMTQLPTMGRFEWFALGMVERMLEERESMDYFEFDTAALAMFLVGRLEQAVELQRTALEKGGAGNPEYAERLRRYEAALGPASGAPADEPERAATPR